MTPRTLGEQRPKWHASTNTHSSLHAGSLHEVYVVDLGASDGDNCGQAFGTTRVEARERAALIVRAVNNHDALVAQAEVIERADMAMGVCCCGDEMANHSSPMNCGHSPVDAGDYSASLVAKKAAAALAALRAAKGGG